MPFQSGNRRAAILAEADEVLKEKRREDLKREADELLKASAPPPAPPMPMPAPARIGRSEGMPIERPNPEPIRPNPLNPNPNEMDRFSNQSFGRDINLPLSSSNATPRPAPIPMDKPAPKLAFPSRGITDTKPGSLPKEFGVTYSDPAYQPASKEEKSDFNKRVLALSKELKTLGIDHELHDFGSRAQGDQDKARDSGASQLGGPDTPSTHQLGVGVDIWLRRNGKFVGGDDPLYKQYGDIAKKYGFTWGGDWKKPYDPRHIQSRPISKYPKPDDISKLNKRP